MRSVVHSPQAHTSTDPTPACETFSPTPTALNPTIRNPTIGTLQGRGPGSAQARGLLCRVVSPGVEGTPNRGAICSRGTPNRGAVSSRGTPERAAGGWRGGAVYGEGGAAMIRILRIRMTHPMGVVQMSLGRRWMRRKEEMLAVVLVEKVGAASEREMLDLGIGHLMGGGCRRAEGWRDLAW